MILTTEERRALDGDYGELRRHALAKTVEYAEIVEADRLCDVTMAHLFCGAHPYLEAHPSKDFDEVYAEMAFTGPADLVFDRRAPGCRCQADVFPLASGDWRAMTDDEDKARLNEAYLSRFAAMGVRLVGTCVPYLTGFVPLPGEHYVSSESHAVLLMNSLWGARGHADGLESGFWAAVCGKTPYWGLHDPDKRKGTALYAVEADLESLHDWDLFGHAAGLKIPPHAIPVLVKYPRPDIHKLKSAMASMATTSGAELIHLVGLTPEAPDVETALSPGASREVVPITRADLEASRALLSCGRRLPVDYVSVGCPHLTPHQIGEVAARLKGRRIAAGVVAHVWTSSLFKEVADRSGHTAVIERSGAKLLANTCPLVSGRLPEGARTLAFDSAKQAHYMRSETGGNVLYGSLDDCLDSAVSGVWEGVAG
jgi:predicted aconitase